MARNQVRSKKVVGRMNFLKVTDIAETLIVDPVTVRREIYS